MNTSNMVSAVGARFRGNHQYVLGGAYILVEEPTNQHDPNAIRVMHEGKHVAYVSRDTIGSADLKRVYTPISEFNAGGLVCHMRPMDAEENECTCIDPDLLCPTERSLASSGCAQHDEAAKEKAAIALQAGIRAMVAMEELE